MTEEQISSLLSTVEILKTTNERLRKQNQSICKKNKELNNIVKKYKNFESSLPFSIDENGRPE